MLREARKMRKNGTKPTPLQAFAALLPLVLVFITPGGIFSLPDYESEREQRLL